MTTLLDILEKYLQWRQLVYRRIDGKTSLEDRESAIIDFNSPGSDCFVFLLSIRAAGRGLNLQSADTVIIYDPDLNPMNKEQAIARAHRIGQTREVKVIIIEAVVDKISSHQKEDELRTGGTVDLDNELAGKDRYMCSIESFIRKNIQQYKIEMANEVINAGRFDQRTTHEERRSTLETLLRDVRRYQETMHDVPSLQEVNRMIARSESEVELFDQMDEELEWVQEMIRFAQVPKWLRASSEEVNVAMATLSKKLSKNILSLNGLGLQSSQMEAKRKRGRPKVEKALNYEDEEIDEEDGECSDADSENIDAYSEPEDDEIQDMEDNVINSTVGAASIDKDQSEAEGPVCNSGCEHLLASESPRMNHKSEEAGPSGSFPNSRRVTLIGSPVSSPKFGSLSALDGRPGFPSGKMSHEVEEKKMAMSGDSQMDHKQPESWTHGHDETGGLQVLQPRIKRKRSNRLRPRQIAERSDHTPANQALYIVFTIRQ